MWLCCVAAHVTVFDGKCSVLAAGLFRTKRLQGDRWRCLSYPWQSVLFNSDPDRWKRQCYTSIALLMLLVTEILAIIHIIISLDPPFTWRSVHLLVLLAPDNLPLITSFTGLHSLGRFVSCFIDLLLCVLRVTTCFFFQLYYFFFFVIFISDRCKQMGIRYCLSEI